MWVQAINNKLTIEELRALSLRDWVWIECLQPFNHTLQVSAYYQKHEDYCPEDTFFCGYPGITFPFDYADYGITWEAYACRPQ